MAEAGPSPWRGPEVGGRPDWIHELGAAEIAALDAAVAKARASGKALRDLTRDDFPLGALAGAVDRWLGALDAGLGFALVRGVPVERYGDDDAALAYWGLGLHMGRAISQNAAGDLLGHVRDTGADGRDPTVRLYKTRERLGFHTDGADTIGLLCLRTGKSGGASRIASSLAVVEELGRRRPDLAKQLFEPFPFDRHGEERPGEPPFFELPICRRSEQGRLATFYIGWYIRDSQRHAQAPRLSEAQRETIDALDAIAGDPAFHLDMAFEPGDIQWLNNAVTLHARTEYQDWDEPARKRHLLRLWLVSPRTSLADDLVNQGIPARDDVASDAEGVGS